MELEGGGAKITAPWISCLIKATDGMSCVGTPEYTFLPVGFNHLIFRTLPLPLNLLS